MAQYKMLDGNAAAVQAVSMAGVKVVSAYPITPQSPIAEKLSDLIAQGTLDAKYIRVESEHSALPESGRLQRQHRWASRSCMKSATRYPVCVFLWLCRW